MMDYMGGKSYGKMSKEDKMYMAQDDLRTLTHAYQIRMSKPRLKAAMKYAQEQLKGVTEMEEM